MAHMSSLRERKGAAAWCAASDLRLQASVRPGPQPDRSGRKRSFGQLVDPEDLEVWLLLVVTSTSEASCVDGVDRKAMVCAVVRFSGDEHDPIALMEIGCRSRLYHRTRVQVANGECVAHEDIGDTRAQYDQARRHRRFVPEVRSGRGLKPEA